ncbi:MAG: TerB family tellurite resistance protein, partial [Thermodesulfobacteriota bacterium]
MSALRKEDGAEALVQLMVKADGRTTMEEMSSYRDAWFYQRRVRGRFDTRTVFNLFRTYSSPQGLLRIEELAADSMRDTPKEYRLALSALLLHVAKSDGAVSGRELGVLRRVGNRLGLAAPEVVAEYQRTYLEGKPPTPIPETPAPRPAGPLRRPGRPEALEILCRLVAKADGEPDARSVKAYTAAPFYRRNVAGQMDGLGLGELFRRYDSPHGRRTLEMLAVDALKGCFDSFKVGAAAMLVHAAKASGGISGNEVEVLSRIFTGMGVPKQEALDAYAAHYAAAPEPAAATPKPKDKKPAAAAKGKKK